MAECPADFLELEIVVGTDVVVAWFLARKLGIVNLVRLCQALKFPLQFDTRAPSQQRFQAHQEIGQTIKRCLSRVVEASKPSSGARAPLIASVKNVARDDIAVLVQCAAYLGFRREETRALVAKINMREFEGLLVEFLD